MTQQAQLCGGAVRTVWVLTILSLELWKSLNVHLRINLLKPKTNSAQLGTTEYEEL